LPKCPLGWTRNFRGDILFRKFSKYCIFYCKNIKLPRTIWASHNLVMHNFAKSTIILNVEDKFHKFAEKDCHAPIRYLCHAVFWELNLLVCGKRHISY
jgi:hypothetical protein